MRAHGLVVRISVSFSGIGLGPHLAKAERAAVRRAAVVARMLASARLLSGG